LTVKVQESKINKKKFFVEEMVVLDEKVTWRVHKTLVLYFNKHYALEE